MTPRRSILLISLLLCLYSRALAEEGLPEFRLNSLKASGIRLPDCGLFIPPPSPPSRLGAFLRGYPPMPPPKEWYPLYRPYLSGFIRLSGGALRTRTGSGGEHGTDNVRIIGRTKLTTNGKNGRVDIKFPAVEFADELPGDEAFLFVKATGTALTPEISWAAVLCSGGDYLGYKGSTLKLPEKPGAFSITETLALGERKALVKETHPWLAGARKKSGGGLDYLCSPEFRKTMKGYTVRTLPRDLAMYHFKYDPKENALKITWRADME